MKYNLKKLEKARELLLNSPEPKISRTYYFGTEKGIIKFKTDANGQIIEKTLL